MNKATDRVRALAEKGALDPREAERLLAAMTPSRADIGARPGLLNRLLNPFAALGTAPGLALAAAVTALGVGVALAFGVRFDGFLDLHVVSSTTLRKAVLDQVAALVPGTLAAWAAALIASRIAARSDARARANARIVDFAIVVGLARAPITLLATPIALFAPKLAPGAAPVMTPGLALMIVLSLVGVAGHITWLWQGFRTASGLAGARAVFTFIAAVAASEAASKLLLSIAH